MKLWIIFCFLFASHYTYAQEIPKTFAVIIVGGGPAGLACATSCVKAGYPTLVCDEEKKGIFYPDFQVTNWPGHQAMNWQKTIEELQKDFTNHGGILAFTHVKAITKNQGIFHVTSDIGIFHSPAVVMATGKLPPAIKPIVTTEQPTRILSRLYDESFLIPSDTAIIIGNSEYTLSTAIHVAARIKRVYLFLQPPWKSSGSVAERIARKLPTLTWIQSNTITAINSLKGKVIVEALSKGSKKPQEASWAIFAEDWTPQSSLVRGLAQHDSSGALITYDDTGITPSIGLFACGEVASHGFLSGIAAAANGLKSSVGVRQFLLDRCPLPFLRAAPKEETPPPTKPTQPAAETGPTGTQE
jgi:thioredoxin reductase